MTKKKMSLRTRIYMFIIVAGIINIIAPCVVHADIFGSEIQDLYVDITDNVKETNDLLNKAFKISLISPYKIFNALENDTSTGLIAQQIHDASKTVALVVATLLLMVDFFKKSINFEWSSRWENILIFLIKIIVVKQVVQNADVIVGHVYALFNYINEKSVGSSVDFLPCGDMKNYKIIPLKDIIENAAAPWWSIIKKSTGIQGDPLDYSISADAVKMFYPDAKFPKDGIQITWDSINFENPTSKMLFSPTFEKIFLYPYFILMKCIAYFIFVIVVGRTFELCVYTLLAPLPLCTFASETTHDTAKNFLRNYIAVILQMTIIGTMFVVYVAMNNYFLSESAVTDLLKGTKLIQLLMLLTLALGVQKSGEWSRRICGAA